MSKPTPTRDYHQLDELLRLEPGAIVNTKEVAAILGYSPRSMPRVIRRPGFPRPLLTGGHKKWRLGDIDGWVGKSAGVASPLGRRPSKYGLMDVTTPSQRAIAEASAAAVDLSFMFSVVRGANDASSPFTVIDRSWDQFTEMLEQPQARGHLPRASYLKSAQSEDPAVRAAARKLKNGEAWVPAVFGITPNDRGNLRWSGNVMAVTALVLDIDNAIPSTPILTVQDALAGIPAHLSLAWHTTYSHTVERPKFRVVIPWQTPISPAEHARCFLAAQRWFRDRLDRVSLSPSTLYFLPSCPPDALDDYRTGTSGTQMAAPSDLLSNWGSI